LLLRQASTSFEHAPLSLVADCEQESQVSTPLMKGAMNELYTAETRPLAPYSVQSWSPYEVTPETRSCPLTTLSAGPPLSPLQGPPLSCE
jgi:hypothetical protein